GRESQSLWPMDADDRDDHPFHCAESAWRSNSVAKNREASWADQTYFLQLSFESGISAGGRCDAVEDAEVFFTPSKPAAIGSLVNLLIIFGFRPERKKILIIGNP